MTLLQYYNKLQNKEISKSRFLTEARKALPQWITPLTSFNDGIKILKNKGIISEAIESEHPTHFTDDSYIEKIKSGVGWTTPEQVMSDLADEIPQNELAQILYKLAQAGILYNDDEADMYYDIPDNSQRISVKDVDKFTNNSSYTASDALLNSTNLNENMDKHPEFAEVDKVNPWEYREGLKCEMESGKKFEVAQKIVLRNLQKDPIYYTNKKAGVTPRVQKKNQMVDVKGSSLNDKTNSPKKVSSEKIKQSAVKSKKETFDLLKGVKHLTQKAIKAKGIKKVMDMPGKEKKVRLKESIKQMIREVLDTVGDIEHNEFDTDKKNWVKNFIDSLKGTDTHFEVAEQYLKNSNLSHDQQIKLLYKLIDMGLIKNDTGFEADTNDLDNSLHTYMHVTDPNDKSQFNENIHHQEERGKNEFDPFMNRLPTDIGAFDIDDNKLIVKVQFGEDPSNYKMVKYPLINFDRFLHDAGHNIDEFPYISPALQHIFVEDFVDSQYKHNLNEVDEKQPESDFKENSEFMLQEDLGKLKKGDRVKVKSIRELANDMELTLINKEGVEDTFYYDKNDKL